ncbi:MAG: hypothetical protein AVDCRST_MAG64-3815 [uncultured Phycisphaerae bacterium]|uniref:Uncharacterized protein n=1 Tax=uncultured Phycisphaerae bacterium TaxID=904963 RepID=A0A6J4QBU6_9BACT|nr:MAG: hypothetical protein AVDCRST_MAG64-3815 [uncultured Phycisphaerae bacterium]
MNDLYFAMLVVGFVSLGALALALFVGNRVSRKAATALCVLVVGLIVAHVLWVSDRPWVARALPVSGVIVLGNGLPPLVAMLAGLAWRLIPGNVARRAVLLGALLVACGHRSLAPVLAAAGPPPQTRDRWRNDVCLQTSPATCSAAAAATLLRAHGIATTEAEMARLCLTREGGTAAHGLYRGLKLKTAGTAWDVEVFDTDAAGLRASAPAAAILTVRLDPVPGIDPRYEQLWGWTPGVQHTVVFFRFTPDGKVEMGDPSVGREHWSAKDLGVLWHGEGMRLVRR